MSDSAKQVRQVLAEVEWHQGRYDAADSIRRTIRLNNGGGGKIVRTVARFGRADRDYEVPLSGLETAAIYEALGVVMDGHRKDIARLEATLVAPVAPVAAVPGEGR